MPPVENRRPIRVATLSDLHVAPPGTPVGYWHNRLHFETALERLDRAIALAGEISADAVLVAGDLAHDGDDETFGRLLAPLSRAGPPVFLVPGNHDAQRSPAALSRAVRRAGSPSLHVVGPAWFALSDTVILAGTGLVATPEEGVFGVEPPQAIGGHGAAFAVWLSHYPVHSREVRFRELGLRYPGDALGIDAVEVALQSCESAVLVVSGHLHARDTLASGRILEITASPSIEAPFELTVVDLILTGIRPRVAVQRVALGTIDRAARDIPLLSPASETWVHDEGWRRE